ncbi:MAG: hypothetical protein H7234_00470 [Herminiimonas sp.]|nr:hypothetical protein [Herminiimonas sp.]
MLACLFTTTVRAAAADAHDAASLLARYGELAPQLQNNQFQRPLYINSSESGDSLTGDIFAVLDYPFATVNTAFNGPDHWCDMLILHLNTKYCRATSQSGKNQLMVSVGKKHDQPLADAYRVNFNLAVTASTPEYLDVVLSARDGPMGTSDYRILLQAVALPNGRTFMHLTYSYAYGMAARIAMKAYLSTVGSGKVGFTRTQGSGEAQYIGGVRGVVERNTMRYYLAIDAYLSAVALPQAQQLDRRLQTWFAATERYPRQLHEVERNDYLDMKRSEYQRQQTAQ